MKKLVILFSFLFAGAGFCAAEVILEPQWSELCHVQYINARPATGFWDKQKLGTYNDYWVERKKQFESSLARCQNYKGDDLSSCYKQVREAELSKNNLYNAKLQQIEAQNQQRHQEYLDQKARYDTVNSINSIIRTIKY